METLLHHPCGGQTGKRTASHPQISWGMRYHGGCLERGGVGQDNLFSEYLGVGDFIHACVIVALDYHICRASPIPLEGEWCGSCGLVK